MNMRLVRPPGGVATPMVTYRVCIHRVYMDMFCVLICVFTVW